MRNGFAHFNIDFYKIAGLFLWNRPEPKQPPNWVCYISVEDLGQLFKKFVAEVRKVSEEAIYAESGIKQVLSEIKRAGSQRAERPVTDHASKRQGKMGKQVFAPEQGR